MRNTSRQPHPPQRRWHASAAAAARIGAFLALSGLAACVSRDTEWESAEGSAAATRFSEMRAAVAGEAPESDLGGWDLHQVGETHYGRHGESGMEFVAARLREDGESLVLLGPGTVQLPSGRHIEVPAGSEVTLRGGELFFDSVPVEEGGFAIPL